MPRIKNTLLLITRNYPPTQGGIETMAHEFAKHASKKGWIVHLVHVGQAACRTCHPEVARYRHLPGTSRWPALIVSTFALPWLVFRLRPNILINMQVTTAPGSLICSRLWRLPYLVFCHGLEVMHVRRGPWFWIRGLALRGAAKTISSSRFTDSLVAAFGVKTATREVILPGTHDFSPGEKVQGRATYFGPEAAKAFVCLSLGRLIPRKGIDTMLEAVARIKETRPEILYCIGGAGPDRPRLEALIAEKRLGNHVRFLGRVADKDLGAVYSGADLFVLISRTSENPPDAEGFGIVILEAALAGTPSIGGRSGGIPDAIVEGETGYLVDPEDSRILSEKILMLMGDREKLRALGEQARARARNQTWAKVCHRYLEASGRVLKSA